MKFLSSFLSSLLLLEGAAAVAIPDRATVSVNHLQSREKKRMKIGDHDLERNEASQTTPDWFKDHGSGLKGYEINPKGKRGTVYSQYSVSKDTYLVYYIKTQDIEGMKARDILIDSFLEANGGDDTDDLTYIGYDNIVHDQTKESIKKAWEKVKFDGLLNRFKKFEEGGDFTISPGKDGWEELIKDNPFVQGAQSMVSEDEYKEVLKGADIDKVRVYINPGGVKMHFYIRLKR